MKPIIIILVLFLVLENKFMCPFREYFGIACPSCGLTRSLKYLLHFQFKESFYAHPMLIFILPAVFFGLLEEKFSGHKKIIDVYICVTAVLFFIVYIIRLSTNSIP